MVPGSIPGQGTKILQTERRWQTKKQKEPRETENGRRCGRTKGRTAGSRHGSATPVKSSEASVTTAAELCRELRWESEEVRLWSLISEKNTT